MENLGAGCEASALIASFFPRGRLLACECRLLWRAVAIAAAIGISAKGLAPSMPFLPSADEPFPCRLTTPEFVDLLKMPTCVNELRRVILDQLGNRYGRRFDTHWDFVRGESGPVRVGSGRVAGCQPDFAQRGRRAERGAPTIGQRPDGLARAATRSRRAKASAWLELATNRRPSRPNRALGGVVASPGTGGATVAAGAQEVNLI
jgi:hypothetical protein